MNSTVTISVQATARPAPVSDLRVTKYSDGWTTDGLPRQRSIDYIGYKDYGYPYGLPDQIKVMPDVWVRLTKTRQEWLFECNCLSAYGKIPSGGLLTEAKATWAELFDDGRCFTNRTGTDTRHDYINNRNTTARDMEYEPLITGGWTLRLTGRRESIPTTYVNYGRQAYPHLEVYGVDPDNLPAPTEFLKDITLCHRPTTIKPNGERGVFPQFSGKAVVPLWGKTVMVWERLLA